MGDNDSSWTGCRSIKVHVNDGVWLVESGQLLSGKESGLWASSKQAKHLQPTLSNLQDDYHHENNSPWRVWSPITPWNAHFGGKPQFTPDFRFASYIYQGQHELGYKICPHAKHEPQKVYELQIHGSTHMPDRTVLFLCEGRWNHKVNREERESWIKDLPGVNNVNDCLFYWS